MDLNGVGQKNIDEINKPSVLWSNPTEEKQAEEKVTGDVSTAKDAASSEALEKLKLQTLEAQEPGRAAYLEKIKAAVANGSYDVPADKLADSLIEDGFLDFLIEE